MSLTKNQKIGQGIFRWSILAVVLGFFAVPLIAMFIYTIKPLAINKPWTFDVWLTLFGFGKQNPRMGMVWEGVGISLLMSVIVVLLMFALLVPTMVIARLYSPKLLKVIEALSTLPLALPAIALVVGLAPVYRFMAAELDMVDSYWLSLAYVIFVLPYSFRSIDAGMKQMDVRTLYEAARSLGESWMGTLIRVIIPNLKTAILSACFISVAVVLGEFTIAAFLGRHNLQLELFMIGRDDPQTSTAVSLLALLFTMIFLVIIDIASSRKKGSKRG